MLSKRNCVYVYVNIASVQYLARKMYAVKLLFALNEASDLCDQIFVKCKITLLFRFVFAAEASKSIELGAQDRNNGGIDQATSAIS